MSQMVILGINGVDELFHDASASLLVDGRIIASVEEERFNRKKHTNGLPFQAIDYCLRTAGVATSSVDHIGYYLQPEVLRQTFLTDILAKYKSDPCSVAHIERAATRITGIEARLRERYAFGPQTHFHFLNHHVAHAASVYYVSGFESAAILTIDGSGDRESSVLFHGQGSEIRKIHDFLVYPESLGFLYNVFAAHLGLGWISGPGKLMGLAGYGCPRLLHDFEDVIKLNDDRSHPVEIDLSFFDYYLGGQGLSAKGRERFGESLTRGATFTQQHFDLAATVQKVLENVVLHLVRQIRRYLPEEHSLCLSGGVALNVTTNRRVRDFGGFENLFVNPPAYDGGTSLGCALYLDAKLCGRRHRSFDAYLGPDIERDFDIENSLCAFGNLIEWRRLPEPELIECAATALAQKRFVGWVQGRMECGPRALGNRSILANPCRLDTKDRLNAGIKKREAFRPYAPSVLQEESAKWFDLDESPYMLLEAMVHAEKRPYIPAVVHVDGSSRPQTVTEAQNPLYYRLIRRFYEHTGIPLILNTSFNQHGEPVVNRPEEAITLLLATELDDLFVGSYHVRRNPAIRRPLEYVVFDGLGIWKGAEIPRLFDRRKAMFYEGVSVTGSRTARIVTSPAQWSWAAAYPLRPEAIHGAARPSKLLLRVRLTVECGRVGVLFVKGDPLTGVGEQLEQGPVGHESSVDVLLDPTPESGWLILRNNTPGNQSSTCTVHNIQGFRANSGLPEAG
jgi:carbamoyltransferase